MNGDNMWEDKKENKRALRAGMKIINKVSVSRRGEKKLCSIKMGESGEETKKQREEVR